MAGRGDRQHPSGRGELEITDINNAYLDISELYVEPIGRGIAWLNGGMPDDLFELGNLSAYWSKGPRCGSPARKRWHCEKVSSHPVRCKRRYNPLRKATIARIS